MTVKLATIAMEMPRTLNDYNLLDRPAEEHLDRITRMAAELLETPYAFISLGEAGRPRIQACHGIDRRAVGRDVVLGAHAIRAGEPFAVEDARLDARFAGCPLVTGAPAIRFYAGVPLRAADGGALGVLCVADAQPRRLDDRNGRLLADLAAIAVNELERRHSDAEREALHAARAYVEEASRLKTTFLTNLSHEIRTPLTGIIGFSEVLTEETTGEHRELAAMLNQSGHRLLDTLDAMFDLAQLENGEMELDVQPLDLARHVGEMLPTFGPPCRRSGLTLELQAADTPVVVPGDRQALGRILWHLLANAVKFTSRGGVTVRVDTDGAYGQIHVIDTGVGIDTAFLPHLFDEFRQESAGLGRDYEGMGLGLTITRGLVEMMGGEVRVQSAKGSGSTFTVRLPLCDPAPAATSGGVL